MNLYSRSAFNIFLIDYLSVPYSSEMILNTWTSKEGLSFAQRGQLQTVHAEHWNLSQELVVDMLLVHHCIEQIQNSGRQVVEFASSIQLNDQFVTYLKA